MSSGPYLCPWQQTEQWWMTPVCAHSHLLHVAHTIASKHYSKPCLIKVRTVGCLIMCSVTAIERNVSVTTELTLKYYTKWQWFGCKMQNHICGRTFVCQIIYWTNDFLEQPQGDETTILGCYTLIFVQIKQSIYNIHGILINWLSLDSYSYLMDRCESWIHSQNVK